MAPHAVTPDLVRSPLCGEGDGERLLPSPVARWTPDQVRGDGGADQPDGAYIWNGAASPSISRFHTGVIHAVT